MVEVTLKDGLLEIRRPPGFLEKELTYDRSSYDLRTRKMKFERERLFAEMDVDGVHMYATMPGFAHRVLSALRKAGIQHEFKDLRTPFPEPDIAKAIQGARDYQVEIIYNMLMAGGGILESATGCLAAGTPVRLFDGTIKPVELIKEGDVLLSFDDTTNSLTSSTVCEMIRTSHKPKPMLEVTINGEKTCTTYDHPFFAGDGFYPLYQLVWGALEAGQRARLKLLCEQYGTPFDDTAVWSKNSGSNAAIIRSERILQDNAGWAYRESSQNSGGELVGKSAWSSCREPCRLQPIKQQGGQPGMVLSEIQCLVWGNPWECKNVQTPETRYLDSGREERDSQALRGENWRKEVETQQPHSSERQDHAGNTDGVSSGKKTVTSLSGEVFVRPFCKIKEAEPYYTIRTREAPYTYCIGKRYCHLTHNSGKTFMTSGIIRAFDPEEWKIRGTPLSLFACPSKDINRKNAEELQRFIPDREVGCVMSGTNRWSDDIICITVDSLHLVDPNEVGLLIVDEMHTIASDTRAEELSKFRKAMRFGVSATPEGRSDGKDIVAEGLLGPVVVKRTYQDMVKAGALVPIEVLWLPLPPPSIGIDRYLRYKLREKKVLYALEENDNLSQEIADILRSCNPNIQVLCMTQHINQISNIHQRCDADVRYMHADTSFKRTDKRTGETYELAYPTVGPVTAQQRKQAYEDFRSGAIMKMVASGTWSTGVDFPRLDVVINSYGAVSSILTKQVAGRASRKSVDKDVAYIVEFWPSWDREDPSEHGSRPGPNMRAAMARRKSYKELGFTQKWITSIAELPFVSPGLASATRTALNPPSARLQQRRLPF